MSRTKAFFKNSFSTIALQIITMVIGFIVPGVMLSCYGSEINGLVSSLTQFISYFTIIEAGLSGAAVYALYGPLAKNDHKEISAIVAAARHFYIQTGFIFVALTFSLAVIYPLYMKTDVLSPWEIGLLVLVLGANGTLEFFTLSKYRVLLTADQKTYIISYFTIIQVVVNAIIVITFSYLNANIVLLRFVALLSIFLRSAFLMIYCRKRYSYINYKGQQNRKALNKRWDALYLQILGTVQIGAPQMIITILFKDLKMLSVYAIFSMIINGLSGILSVFTSGLSASFGDVIFKNESETLKRAYKEFEYIYYLIITVIYSTAFITIMPFVRVYTKNVTDTNYNLPFLGFLFVLNGLLYNIKVPQGMLVNSAGLYKETRIQSTIQSLILIICGCVFGYFWGLYGVIFGVILSNVYRIIDLVYYMLKKLIKIPLRHTYYRIGRIFICALVSWFLFSFVNWNLSNFMEWILYALLAGITCLVVTLTINIIFDKKETQNVLKRILGVIKAK